MFVTLFAPSVYGLTINNDYLTMMHGSCTGLVPSTKFQNILGDPHNYQLGVGDPLRFMEGLVRLTGQI